MWVMASSLRSAGRVRYSCGGYSLPESSVEFINGLVGVCGGRGDARMVWVYGGLCSGSRLLGLRGVR